MSTKRTTIATYDASAAQMAADFDGAGARSFDVEKAFELLGPKQNPKTLEIGCGNGRDAREILKRTMDYLGMDASEGLLAIARERNPGAMFVLADLEEYDFPERLDLVFAFASLLHSPQDKVAEVLKRAHAALAPGGIFYISLKMGAYREETKHDAFGTRTFYRYTPELIQELAGPGYETAWIDTQFVRNQDWFTIALRKKDF